MEASKQAPRPVPLYTGDEMVQRWRARAERMRGRPDVTLTEIGMAVSLEGCAAELEGALWSARQFASTTDGNMVTCDRLPGTPHKQLHDTDEALGCIEPISVYDHPEADHNNYPPGTMLETDDGTWVVCSDGVARELAP